MEKKEEPSKAGDYQILVHQSPVLAKLDQPVTVEDKDNKDLTKKEEKENLAPESKETKLKSIEERIEELSRKCVSSLQNKMEDGISSKMEKTLFPIIESQVEKHMNAIKWNVDIKLPSLIEDKINPTNITNTLDAQKESVHENMTFCVQKILIPSFEESTHKLFVEMAKSFQQGIVEYRKKLGADDTALAELNSRKTNCLKLTDEENSKLEALIEKQLDNLKSIEEFTKHEVDHPIPKINKRKKKPIARVEMPIPVSSIKKTESVPIAKSNFEALPSESLPLAPVFETPGSTPYEIKEDADPNFPQTLINKLEQALLSHDLTKAMNIASTYDMSTNYFLEILNSFDLRAICTYRDKETLNHGYIRKSLYVILKYLQENTGAITPDFIGLVKKGKELVVFDQNSIKEYQKIREMITQFEMMVATKTEFI